mmetsp:Transcript_5558/g.12226  ORF Transcript_5558/g.12226 Transcript_5558/m.12226 type:complete len:281 (-) Transcript_5558:282-1124(-)
MSSRSSRSAGSDGDRPKASMTAHQALRAKKQAEIESRAIQNRIEYFKREEEKIWKDLDAVRRQANKIEDGRGRVTEKKMVGQMLQEAKVKTVVENRQKARLIREETESHKSQSAAELRRAKALAGEARKREAMEAAQKKRMVEAQERLRNTERAVAIQRAQLEAKLRTSKEQADRLASLREEHESEKRVAEDEVIAVESRLPELEREEQIWLQRLQNSRIVTQSVLDELETSLGTGTQVTSLLKTKPGSRLDVLCSPGKAPHPMEDTFEEEPLDVQEKAD